VAIEQFERGFFFVFFAAQIIAPRRGAITKSSKQFDKVGKTRYNIRVNTTTEKKMKIVFHELCTRQFDKNSEYTTWTCDNEEILNRTIEAFNKGMYREGNAVGSFIITISSENVLSNFVTLEVGQKLEGVYEPRRGTDYATKKINAVPQNGQTRLPALYCEVIAYDMEGVLNIVSVNGSPTSEPTPISPMTLIRNYFKIGLDQIHGTNLTLEQFAEELYKSVLFHEDKAQLTSK
tara:strand:- start:604 stop:1305 length:702 start_codon:yes stop_codon:yes gene_type:complete